MAGRIGGLGRSPGVNQFGSGYTSPYQKPTSRLPIDPQGQYRNMTGLRPIGGTTDSEGNTVTQFGREPDPELRARLLRMLDEGGDGGEVPPISRVSGDIAEREEAARTAAFNRFKDKAGQNARASLNSLRDTLSRTGRAGGAFEDSQLAGLIGETGGDLDSFLRDQAINEAERAQEVGDLEFQGGIAQRGQTLQSQQAARNALFELLLSSGSLF